MVRCHHGQSCVTRLVARVVSSNTVSPFLTNHCPTLLLLLVGLGTIQIICPLPASLSPSPPPTTTASTTTTTWMFSKLRFTRNLQRIQTLYAKFLGSSQTLSRNRHVTYRNTNTETTSTSSMTTTSTTATTMSFFVCNQTILQQQYTIHSSSRSRRSYRQRNIHRHSIPPYKPTPLLNGKLNNGDSIATATATLLSSYETPRASIFELTICIATRSPIATKLLPPPSPQHPPLSLSTPCNLYKF